MTTKKSLAALEKYHAGIESLTNGFAQESLALFSDAIGYDPGNAMFYLRRSQAYSILDKGAAAMVDAMRAIKKDPSNPECHLRRAECCLMHEGNLEECIVAVDAGLQRNPEHVALRLLRLETLFLKCDFKALADQALTVMRSTTNPHVVLKASRLLKFAQTALKVEPDADLKDLEDVDTGMFVSTMVSLGQKSLSSGDPHRAIEQWKNAALLATALDSPSLLRMIQGKLAAAYRAIGRPDLSATLVSGSSDQATTHMDTGNTMFSAGNYDAALESFTRAMEIETALHNDAGLAAASNNKACVLFALRRFEEALNLFKRQNELALKEFDYTRMVASWNDICECNLMLENTKEAHSALSLALDAHEQLHKATIGTSNSQANIELYFSLVIRSFSLAVQLFVRVGKFEEAFEWSERVRTARADRMEYDLTIDEIKQLASRLQCSLVGFHVGSRAVEVFLVSQSGDVKHHSTSRDVLRLVDPTLIYHEAKAAEGSSDEDEEEETGGAKVDEAKGVLPAQRRLQSIFKSLLGEFSRNLGDQVCFVVEGALAAVPWNSLFDGQAYLGNSATTLVTTSLSRLHALVSASNSETPFSLATLVDRSIPNEAQISIEQACEKAGVSVTLSEPLGTGSFKKSLDAASTNSVVFLRCRMCLRRMYVEDTVDLTKVLGSAMAVPKSGRRNPAYSTTTLRATGTMPILDRGVLFASTKGTDPYFVHDRLSTVTTGNCVPVMEIPNCSSLKGKVVILDVHGQPEDLTSITMDHVEAFLKAGVQAVIAPLSPAIQSAERERFWIDVLKFLQPSFTLPQLFNSLHLAEIRNPSTNCCDTLSLQVFF